MWSKRDVARKFAFKLQEASYHLGKLSKISNNEADLEVKRRYISLKLPLPYRVAVAIVLGIWAWGINIHYLSFCNINVFSLVYPPRVSSRTSFPSHLSTYRLALVLTGPLIVSILLFWTLYREGASFTYLSFLPITYLCFLAGIFILPMRDFCSPGRYRFITTLRRISIGGLAQTKDRKLGDILLADVLTSYAKIIADIFVTLCTFFNSSPNLMIANADQDCGGEYFVPLITSIPYLIRLRQCLTEYFRVHSTGESGGSQHLANALKYISALPVIVFSALQHSTSLKKEKLGLTEQNIYYCWFTASTINALYSFYWDVAKDWDLEIFSALNRCCTSNRRFSTSIELHTPHSNTTYSFGLRPHLYLPSSDLYYLAITLDFFLRFSWSLRLSPHLSRFTSSEYGIIFFEFSEIGRRWIWTFLRLETEWARKPGNRGESVLDDVLDERYEDFEGSY